MINDRMDVNDWLRKQLEQADPDLLREMVRSFAETLMSADADETCGAPYGRRVSRAFHTVAIPPEARTSRSW